MFRSLGGSVRRGLWVFSNARNNAKDLEALTPPWLRVRVLTKGEIPVSRGTQIDYRLRLRGVPLRWLSEITAREPPHRFVGEQVAGLCRNWIHEHRFEARGRPGRNPVVVAHDEVRYPAPGGRLVNRFLVAPDVERIFAYRTKRLRERFGTPGARPQTRADFSDRVPRVP